MYINMHKKGVWETKIEFLPSRGELNVACL